MWILYSLLTAFFLATSDALTKKALFTRDEYFIAWARLVFALPFLIASLLFVEIPSLDRTFWFATLCALPLEITAIILYTKALKISPISLTMPFLALTPLFLILMSRIILGEQVTLRGGIGIVLMAAGSYVLNIHRIRQGFFAPLKAIAREKGAVFMIIVSFIFSITSSLGKVAIEHSSPVFFGAFYFVLVTLLFTPVALKKNRGPGITKKDIVSLSSIGATYSIMIIFHMLAMSMTNVAYMISIKRTSLFISIIYGHFMFREEKLTEKTVGSIMLFAGFLLIILGNA